MYSMPNGEQHHEGVESDGGSADWQSEDDSEEDSKDSGSSEEVDSPPRSERHSKQLQDPAGGRGKAVPPSTKVPKRTRTSTPEPSEKAAKQPKVVPPKPRKALPKIKVVVPVAFVAATSATSMDVDEECGDAETADAATSRAALTNVIQLPDDDDEDVPPRDTGRRGRTLSKRTPSARTSRSALEPVVQQLGEPVWTSVSFADPLSTDQPSASTAQAPSPIAQVQASAPPATSSVPSSPLFVTQHVPEDQVGAAKEAMIQAGLMMDRLKVVYDTSKAAYDASSALQPNVRKSCELGTKFADLEKKQIQLNLDLELAKENLKKAQDEAVVMGDKMKQALEQKDLDLAAAQKTAREKTELADKKLASVGKLEEENAKLRTAVDEANKEVVQLKEEKMALADKVDVLTQKRDELEDYLGGLAKMFLMLEEFCRNFEEGTWWIETGLDPINSPVKDEAAMNVLRLESRLASVLDYIARLKVALSRIDKELRPKDVFQNDLESLMTRLNDIPDRVQAWKKSSARCGADVVLSLVRVHCKDAKEEKLKALQVANTKKLQFQSFMETFIDAVTRIADGIDLDTFVEPASPPPAE
ncbi:hypothetical protein VPH35_118431 [Triticum aestivum]